LNCDPDSCTENLPKFIYLLKQTKNEKTFVLVGHDVYGGL
jgi:hypothetical protein